MVADSNTASGHHLSAASSFRFDSGGNERNAAPVESIPGAIFRKAKQMNSGVQFFCACERIVYVQVRFPDR